MKRLAASPLFVAYPQLVPAGRLGSYKYLDMHQAIAGALQLVHKELSQ